MVKVYIGGRYQDYPEIRKIMNLVRSAGHTITVDWTDRAKLVYNYIMSKDLISDSIVDFNGVYDADWTILHLVDIGYMYRGTFCELGASLMRDRMRGLGRRTIIIDSEDKTYAATLCYFHHPDTIHVSCIEDAIIYLKTV